MYSDQTRIFKMPSPRHPKSIGQTLSAFYDLMAPWPRSWAGSKDDIPVGESLVAELRPFIAHLCSLDLTLKTIRRHLDNCWVIGGEIIRGVVENPKLRKTPPRKLLLNAIDFGEAPLVHPFSEVEQRSLDATARRLLRFFAS